MASRSTSIQHSTVLSVYRGRLGRPGCGNAAQNTMAPTQIELSGQLPPKDTSDGEAFNRWYTTAIRRSELADYFEAVGGTMVIRPYGFSLWELMQSALDGRLKATGHKNAYFPLFVPESFLRREAKHVEGFAPEVAWVTNAGGEDLQE